MATSFMPPGRAGSRASETPLTPFVLQRDLVDSFLHGSKQLLVRANRVRGPSPHDDAVKSGGSGARAWAGATARTRGGRSIPIGLHDCRPNSRGLTGGSIVARLLEARPSSDQTCDPWSSSENDDERAPFHHPDRHYDHYYYPAACPGGAEE